ncbi:MAG: bis(5'-nucleosyl)-tetraphosphatase (symmetrical) YqeK [Meiothermus sp.]|uniref:bis(5'-nucleosyl)-tetraphosphatase (symmetrical) YqeK n=1 Tax=Meiothermus sp. TaxID=1955249 RepID=UPI0025FD5CCF|nr:bis(5'-nucleosyl)-tetraphosphatase (symmetrical) YqeK [Meiothermus sp.]MCS7058300.1 bis(5'-nucleosyl)-tetraphosphatase (symmetrical) YqeK [Meiothermus sp.]MCS7194799.1 bis(5'-nucleosyl)-tetraphosphatase (symmetrical) YqeK [Meiothermus sp.]MCX7739919.1 bis(5'-nucleosyl)-tetraphosphatase (symmetrical) YqeK [Meiothermus sp.]MDW8090331.1 bis(5'-nucleosyl)-tetraphosphatase (symmetrical) YqeK [Meiothermus sp.]MDW8481169.1 bis(5'-nucleosyl)-tetraphosphatase (symmetrical) YqeK [Meiothermus sp.]
MTNPVAATDFVERVRQRVRPERFAHILRVAELAAAIARANGLDPERAYLAGILHDAARDLSPEELVLLAPPENEVERRHPLALHGRAARRMAREWGVQDEEVLEAVEGHVYGVDPAHQIGMALYVADVSEPGRGVNHEIRQRALEGRLLEAYREAVACKVNYLQSRGIEPHPRTRAAYEALQRPPCPRV